MENERLYKIMTPEEEAIEEANLEAELYLERNEHLVLDTPEKSEKEMLNEILENTKTVKTVIVEKFEKKPPKEKSAKQKAEAKFKMVGTKLNPKELEEFEAKLERLDINPSQYFKKASKFDFEENKELIERQEKAIQEYIDKLNLFEEDLKKKKTKMNEQDTKIKTLEDTISSLNTQLDKELNKTLWQRIRALF